MKNFKQILKLALASAMSLAILTSSLMIVSADPGLVDNGTEGTSAVGTLSKFLEVTNGVEIPDLTFSYLFTKVSVDNNASTEAKATMPNLSTTTAFTEGQTGTAGTGDQTGFNLLDSDSPNFLLGASWPHAGAYVYNVTEVADVSETLGTKQSITYSEAMYEMIVYVANKSAYDNTMYVAAIEYRIKKDDAGETASGDKADPVFTNRYNVLTDLVISKTVAGDYGDLTRKFDYSVTLNKSPAETAETPTYIGKIYNISNPGPSGTQIGSNITVAFDAADTFKTVNGIKLAHNEYIVFESLPTGTTYTVTENLNDAVRPGEKDYLPSVIVTENGGIPTAGPAGTAGASLIVPVTNLGEGDNVAAFTNTHQDPSITGILINNLPYIMMILLAVGGLVAYIALKRRKANRF